MTASLVGLMREGFLLALLLAAPFLVAALIAGVISGLVGAVTQIQDVGSSRVDLQACKLEYSIVSPK